MAMREIQDQEDWDAYWKKQKKGAGLYKIIAELYRRFPIKRSLNHFIYKYFNKNAQLLHAGCGSGQVDEDISRTMSITALDISPHALEIYERANQGRGTILRGSIFKIPADKESFDGIYNLGVMEHFSHDEIRQILEEFKRVLKPKGKIVLFWPPEYGLSVMALKIIHFVLNDIFRRDVKLHPDEISRLQSRGQAREILLKSGFRMVEYAFGPRDMFTQVALVAENLDGNDG